MTLIKLFQIYKNSYILGGGLYICQGVEKISEFFPGILKEYKSFVKGLLKQSNKIRIKE